MRIPSALQEEWSREPDWLARLPALVRECAEQWSLILEEPFDTPHSLVVPAGDAVLKINAPSHIEAAHEAAALACWDGNAAVRLLADDRERHALLIERCRPGTPLWETTADAVAVVTGLLPRLRSKLPDENPFAKVADEAERWADELREHYEADPSPFDRRLLSLALDVFGSVDRNAVTLVNQDLHGGNVLRAEREPWLVVDPKPVVGEPEVDGVGLLRNAAWEGGVAAVRIWLDALAELGLDRDRLRDWGAAHALAWGWEHTGRWSEGAVEAALAIAAA